MLAAYCFEGSGFKQILCSTTDRHKKNSPQYQISCKSVQFDPRWYVGMDGQADMTDILGAFGDFLKASREAACLTVNQVEY